MWTSPFIAAGVLITFRIFVWRQEERRCVGLNFRQPSFFIATGATQFTHQGSKLVATGAVSANQHNSGCLGEEET
jgi:hypothetical protein